MNSVIVVDVISYQPPIYQPSVYLQPVSYAQPIDMPPIYYGESYAEEIINDRPWVHHHRSSGNNGVNNLINEF